MYKIDFLINIIQIYTIPAMSDTELRGLCNGILKYGECPHGSECFYVGSHPKALEMHLKFKRDNKCVWCALGHCKRCHQPKPKPVKCKVDSDGWQIVGPQKKLTPVKPIEVQLIDWLKAIKEGAEAEMPKFEGKIKFSFEDKTYVFLQGKGFVVKTKTIVNLEEIPVRDVPVPVSDAWKEPVNTIYSKERQEISQLLNQEEEETPVVSAPANESEDESEDDEKNYWNSMQEVGKKAIYQECDDVWDSFDN